MDGSNIIRQKVQFWPIWGFFRGFWTPFGALGTQRVFPKKFFYSAQLDMKMQLAAKFQKKMMGGYRALVRTHARTDARTHGRH